MSKDKFINIRVTGDFAIELDQLHKDYQASEMVSISFSAFMEMLARRGAAQIQKRVDITAYAITDAA